MPIAEGRPEQVHSPTGRIPLWITAITVALLSAGFRRTRFAGRATHPLRENDPGRQRPVEAGRGRQADAPSDIPVPGWKDILLRVYRKLSRDRVVLVAAGITFYSILALFPAIAALVAVYGLFSDPATIAGHIDSLAGVLPEGAIEVIRDQMNRVAAQGNSTLGVAFIIGLAVSLWSANAGMKSLFDALNLVYDEEEKRSFVKLNTVSLLFTTSAILFMLLSMAAIVIVPLLFDFVGLGESNRLLALLRWPLLLVVTALGLAILYRYGPSRAKPRWRWITWGSGLAAVVWLGESLLFSWYAANFGSYNKTYGALGAIIGFMIWIWLSTIVILLGAEIDAEMEHQTIRDTTTGTPKPLGSRGATMADTVGAVQE